MTKERRRQRKASKANKRARKPSNGLLGRVLIMLAIVAAVVFGVTLFFKVNRIEVQGNSIYSAEKIVQASAVDIGDNLLTVNRAAVGGNIKAALPYVEEVSVGRSLPDTVVIQVRESEAAFAVACDTNVTWLINTGGKALEKAEPGTEEDYPQILGLSIKSPTAGQTITAEDQQTLDAALQILSRLDGTGILEKINSVNVEKTFDIVLRYEDRYEILLGGTENLDYKIQYLTAILEELSEYQAGTIDLTLASEKKATFIPLVD